MSVRAQPFFFTALNVDSTPIQNTAVIAQFIGTPPLFYPDSGVDDGVNEGPFTVGSTNSSGYTTFSLICPPDTTETSGYYIVTIGPLVYTTSSFAYVSSTPRNFSAVTVAPSSGPTTVNMLAQWWQVNATGWQNAFLTIGLEVDGIIDSSSAAVSATDQTTFFADGSGLITAPLIPTSLFRGSIKPKWKAILPSGASYLFVAPDIGGDIFAGASIASGTSIVGPAGPAAATDWYTTTGNMTATATNNSILADATGGNIIITLPSAATANTPFAVAKKDSSANTVTVTPASGTIDGASTKVITTQHLCVVVLSDGTNWYSWVDPIPATELTDGTHDNTNVRKITVSNMTVGGTSDATTLTPNTATTAALGIVKPDNSSITISAGVISATGTLELTDGSTDLTSVTKITTTSMTVGGTSAAATLVPKTATSSTLGIVKPDNTTIAISAGVLTVVGGVTTFSWATKTTTYAVTTTDTGILADSTSASFVVTLPTAVSSTQEITIKKKDSSVNTVTVATTSSQTIDGASTFVLSIQNESITVGSDGSNWYII